MGRIADALKRAESERRTAIGLWPDEAGVVASAWRSFPATAQPAPAPDVPEIEAGPADRPGVIQGLSESLVPFFEPASLVTEQYRSLRTRLLSQNPECEHRIVAITSAVPKEGKSVTTLNLGCVLAEIRHLRVLVVDGDFRRSSLGRLLNQPEGPGLADVLAGQASYDEAIRDTPIPNLKFLPAGSTRRRSAAELLTDARAAPTFQRMQSGFHYTLVDTPPATTVTDVGIIGQMCSGVIVVVRLHRTHEAAAKQAVRLLQVNNVAIVGCMVVGRDAAIDRYGYGYHYKHDRDYNYLKEQDGQSRRA